MLRGHYVKMHKMDLSYIGCTGCTVCKSIEFKRQLFSCNVTLIPSVAYNKHAGLSRGWHGLDIIMQVKMLIGPAMVGNMLIKVYSTVYTGGL